MKKLLIIMIAIVAFYSGLQIYWIIKNKGNVIVYTSNYSDLDKVDIKILLDGIQIHDSSFNNEYFLDYKKVALRKSIGYHSLEVVAMDGNLRKEYNFFSLGIKWVVIEFVNDNGNMKKYDFFVSIESTPPAWE